MLAREAERLRPGDRVMARVDRAGFGAAFHATVLRVWCSVARMGVLITHVEVERSSDGRRIECAPRHLRRAQ